MSTEEWLADVENQAALYAICEQAIEVLAPAEAPVFEEVFPDYVALVQKGEVVTGAQATEAFGFSGEGDLVTLFLIPFVIDVVNTLLITYGVVSLRAIGRRWLTRDESAVTGIDKSGSEIREHLREVVQGTLEREGQIITDPELFVQTLVSSIIDCLTAGEAEADAQTINNGSETGG